MRGGALLGGTRRAARQLRRGGDQVRRDKAPCRVILTAPPATATATPAATRLARAGRAVRARRSVPRAAPKAHGACAAAARVPPMFVLIVGAGRVGSAVAKRARATGHRCRCSTRTRSRTSASTWTSTALGGRRRPVHGRHRARDGRADGGRHRARRRVHRLHQRRQHQPGHRPDRPAALRRRRVVVARARPAPCRLVRRAGAAHDLPDPDRDRAARRRRARPRPGGGRPDVRASSRAPARWAGTWPAS